MIDLEMGSRTQARRLWALAGAVVLVAVALGALALPRGAEAADLYLAPGYFAGGLTSASSWEEILRTPGVVSDFPAIGFEVRFVPLPLTCLAKERLRPRDASFSYEGPSAREGGRYAVSVYRVILTNINPPLRVFLFNKTFDVPACPLWEGGR
jgi:hypothetical protein